MMGGLITPLLTLLASVLTPGVLRCEYRDNPMGTDVKRPRLSWILESKQRGAKQTAYQILVASSEENLKAGRGDLWDSGKVLSDRTVNIEYAGKPLASRQRAFWKTRSWDGKGEASGWSKPAIWEMGLLAPEDWKAKWIGVESRAAQPEDVKDVRWVWTAEGDAGNRPAGPRLFRLRFNIPADRPIRDAFLLATADDNFKASVNGKEVGTGNAWKSFVRMSLKEAVRVGPNTVMVTATNATPGPAGLAALVKVVYADGSQRYVSGPNWQGTSSTAPGEADWKAVDSFANIGVQPWGTPSQTTVPPPAAHLRRDFAVGQPIKKARVYASAKGLYRLWINGREISPDLFTPGWTDYHKRIQYQTYDVTPLVKSGANALGVLLGDGWYTGNIGWAGRNNYGPATRALVQLELTYADGSTQTVATGPDWKASEDGPVRSSDMQMGEEYDARKEVTGWAMPGFDDAKWTAAVAEPLGDVPLVASPGPAVRRFTEIPVKSVTEKPGGAYVFDLGQNMVGWVRLRVKGPAGATVRIRHAEMLNPDGTIYTTNLRGAKSTDTYTLKGGGVEVFEPSFTFHGFRYVELTGFPGKPDKDAIKGVVVTSAWQPSGDFACSNEMVNKLQANINWGLMGNFLEVPTDCPQRDERLGWMGDAQIFVRTATFNRDVAAFMTKFVQDIVDAQSPAGEFADVSPRVPAMPSGGAPAWADAGVIVPWTLYQVYDDTRLIETHFEPMRRWVEYVRKNNPDGLWTKVRGNDYGDWLSIKADTPKEVLATAFYANSTRLVAKMADALGRSDDARKYEALFQEIKAAFNKAFVAQDGRIKGDTQTAYILALRFGLLPDSLKEAATRHLTDNIVNKFNTHLSTGFLGVGHLNPTLTQVGAVDVAYKLLLNDTFPSWGYSIKQGATTIWERWDGWTEEKGFQDPGMNSFNHYSLGSVGEWMADTVAGIGLAEPGFKKIILKPQPGGGLTWARARYESVNGLILSTWRHDKGTFTYNVRVPANTTALVYVPTKDTNAVKESGKSIRAAEGVRFLRTENGAAVYEVGSGSYAFTAPL